MSAAAQRRTGFDDSLRLDIMSGYLTLLVSFGLLAPLVVAVGAVECSEKEALLRPIASTVTKVTDCLMECTGMTYIRKLQLQDAHNIRLKDSTEGKKTQKAMFLLGAALKLPTLIIPEPKAAPSPFITISFPRGPRWILLVYGSQVHRRRELSLCLRGAACGYICTCTWAGGSQSHSSSCRRTARTRRLLHSRRRLRPPLRCHGAFQHRDGRDLCLHTGYQPGRRPGGQSP